MTDATSYLDVFRKFGNDLGLPKPDIEKLLETQKKNLDALNQSAKGAVQGVESTAIMTPTRNVPCSDSCCGLNR